MQVNSKNVEEIALEDEDEDKDEDENQSVNGVDEKWNHENEQEEDHEERLLLSPPSISPSHQDSSSSSRSSSHRRSILHSDPNTTTEAIVDPPPTSSLKRSTLQDRLYHLKLKINQSQQLNRKEVIREAERLGSDEGIFHYKKELRRQDKERKEQEKQEIFQKLIHSESQSSSTQEKNANGTILVSNQMTNPSQCKKQESFCQSAAESVRHAHKKAERKEKNQFSVNDYYNPEGQFRNYERSVKSLLTHPTHPTPISGLAQERTTGNLNVESSIHDIHHGYDTSKSDAQAYHREREGAHRLAEELQRRAEKTQKNKWKRSAKNFQANDVNSINKRNKSYNEKIARDYNPHTAEIRQNFERGTAL